MTSKNRVLIKPSFKLLIFLTLLLAFIVFVLPQILVTSNHKYSFANTEQVKNLVGEEPKTAIVFGGGIRSNKPSPVLEKRLIAAEELYNEGLINKIIVSGDYDSPFYDEPGTMQNYLVQNGIPSNKIIVDRAGFSTYETCERASKVFELKQAIAVTQAGHLDRAIYLCRSFGIETYGYSAERAGAKARTSQVLRETASNIKAVFNVHFIGEDTVITRPEPTG